MKRLEDVKKKIRLNYDIYIDELDGEELCIKKGTILDYIQRERVQEGDWIGYKEAIIYNNEEYDVCFDDDCFEVIGE